MKKSKEQNVIEFYVLCNKLKDVVRTGWKNWGVKRKRVESIAEHIYGVQMLAIAMWSEYGYKIDLKKVLSMIAVHELEETTIGDLTPYQISREGKMKIGHEAVEKILSPLSRGNEIKELIYEFDSNTTEEAKFAHYCDKLEADIQCKLYDEQNCVDLKRKSSLEATFDKDVKSLLENEKSWSRMWIKVWQQRNKYKGDFLKVSNYILNNEISQTNTKQKRNKKK